MYLSLCIASPITFHHLSFLLLSSITNQLPYPTLPFAGHGDLELQALESVLSNPDADDALRTGTIPLIPGDLDSVAFHTYQQSDADKLSAGRDPLPADFDLPMELPPFSSLTVPKSLSATLTAAATVAGIYAVYAKFFR